ncbi:hypothetical protein [Planobispora takensis]|uniref:Uncharacterized protein n=1 Tax=Planobispora takensis TaxID=1367882 RepID=A0A8J3SW71_9ACTN|nr:hypothetical protein [Planobispora takensis]GII01769.1 hypothetical protein Pta02_37770 [Planobispora takensis]
MRDEQLARIDGDPAFVLEEGKGYVRAWARAQHAVRDLKDSLSAVGLPEAMPYLRADVNVFGVGFVELGRVTPETAALIAQALTLLTAQAKLEDGDAGCAA